MALSLATTEADTFVHRDRAQACAQAIDFIIKTIGAGGAITNVGIGFVPAHGGRVDDGDYTVVTVVTDRRNIPQKGPGSYVVSGGITRGSVRFG